MINVDPTLSQENRAKRRMRNTYADLWAIFLVIVVLIISYVNFGSINVFKTFWAYGNIAFVTDDSEFFEINENVSIIRPNYREEYLDQLELDLIQSEFKVLERQTHKIIFEKDGLRRTYEFKERSLIGTNYIIVKMIEEVE